MKPAAKQIAMERMQILLETAQSNARDDYPLAQRQARIAKKISTKYRLPMPYELKICYCKKCKKFIAPGINSRIRLGRGKIKAVRITCNFCEHTYRKVISQ